MEYQRPQGLPGSPGHGGLRGVLMVYGHPKAAAPPAGSGGPSAALPAPAATNAEVQENGPATAGTEVASGNATPAEAEQHARGHTPQPGTGKGGKRQVQRRVQNVSHEVVAAAPQAAVSRSDANHTFNDARASLWPSGLCFPHHRAFPFGPVFECKGTPPPGLIPPTRPRGPCFSTKGGARTFSPPPGTPFRTSF